MASSSSSSHNQTPPSYPTTWDVFLSFRGIDTRYKFTDYLYDSLQRTGIRTYRDDPELRSGEVISDALLQAIRESKTYIVVLSKNYASSRWCLDELVEIFSCYKSMGRLVVPVFYKIEPLVVRHQTGSFNQAFAKHETRFDMDTLAKWRVTLMNVANLSGYHVSKNKSQTDIIKEVVDRVLQEINPKTLDVAKYPVGLDSRVEDITTLLSSDTQGVIRIGIHGMGGVGKTTLAKAVYNQNYHRFQGSCFLANVREVSGTEKGLVCLQQKLINDVLKCKNIIIDNVDQGIELIKARICLTKVLIVIDDLDDPRPLDYLQGSFASGSIILITTRNEDLLDLIKVEARYKVNELGDAESRQLFTQHAFGNNKISDTFMELSEEILERAGGLPLALKVFGSNLLNQSEEGWRWYIGKLKRVTVDDIEKKLVISFDALKLVDPVLQHIFLDIACFFIGKEIAGVVKIMETCYTYVSHNIDILKKRCLLTTNKHEFGMHDLLRDMGREIARNNSPDEQGKHSRLWVSKDICDVLMKHKGTEAIEGIVPSNYYAYQNSLKGVLCAAETFKRMNKLRFLNLEGVNLTGNFEQTLENLRWLRWDWCPLECLPSELNPQKLVILELRNSKLRTLWEVNMVLKVFENLKTLDMSFSLDLTTTPDFVMLPCLETLNLDGCRSLEEVHKSIGSLVRLVSLNLNGCVKLRSLPYTICNLRALEVLDVRDCCNLFSIEKLPSNLKQINAYGCTCMERLPNLSNLKQLKKLDISDCSGLTDILGLEELTSIRVLYLRGCNSSVAYINSTKSLFQIYSGFGHPIQINAPAFPYWITQSVKWNNQSPYSRSQSIEINLGLLQNVSHNFLGMILCFEFYSFNTTGYSVKTTPSDFIWSDKLETHYCDSESLMVILPRSIFSVRDGDVRIELTADGKKDILGIYPLYEPEITLADKYKSTTVNVEDERRQFSTQVFNEDVEISFDELKLVDPRLQDIFLDIACFFIGWNKEKVVKILESCYTSVIHNIDILKERCLLRINNRDELEMHDLLHHLARKTARKNSPDEPGKHSRLWLSVDIFDVLNKQKGTEAIEGIIPRKLPYSDAYEGKSFMTETFKRMSKLRFLYLKKVTLTGRFEETFENLRWLCWDCCPLKCLPSEFYPEKLVILELPHSNLQTAWEPNMASRVLEKLKTLNMSYSLDLATTPDFTKLPCLETVNFEYCESLEEVHISIGSLVRLVSLDLNGCVNLRSLPDTICNLRALEVLSIGGCSSLEGLPIELGNIKSLRELNAEKLTISELPNSFRHLHNLVELRLRSNDNLETLPDTIWDLRSLEILDLTYCRHLLSIAELPPNLKRISAHGCTSLERLPNLSNLKQLEELQLAYCSGLTEIQGLEELTSLRELGLRRCSTSLLAYILTQRFFQIYSKLGHEINIYTHSAEFPDWISRSSSLRSTIRSSTHNLLGMVLSFKHCQDFYISNDSFEPISWRGSYSIKNTTSDSVWSGSYYMQSCMVIVPTSIFSVRDGHNKLSHFHNHVAANIDYFYEQQQQQLEGGQNNSPEKRKNPSYEKEFSTNKKQQLLCRPSLDGVE